MNNHLKFGRHFLDTLYKDVEMQFVTECAMYVKHHSFLVLGKKDLEKFNG
jgi:hypothetical protein